MDRIIARLGSSPYGPILLGVAYFGCAEVSLRLTSGFDGIATVWPPSGILLATLLMVSRRLVWRYALAAIVASWTANFIAGFDPLLATGLTAANLIEALIATLLLRRRASCRVSFVNPQGLGSFALATLFAAAISASLAFFVHPLSDWHFFSSWFSTVWLGMLLVTPPLMVIYEGTTSVGKLVPVIGLRTLLMIAVVAAVACFATFFQSVYPLLFLPMMVAIAAVLRGGALGGIIVVGTATVFGSWALSQGHGPVSLIQAPRENQVLFFQIYLAALFLSALPMARLLAGQERLRIDLAERIRLLDQAERAGHVGHWRVSPVEQTIYWSPEVCRIHGVAVGEPPAMADAIDFYHPDDRAMVADLVARALSDGEPFDFTARIVRTDGSVRHVASRGERDYSSKSDAIGLFGVIQDITEQVEVRQSLARARDVAEQSTHEALALADTDPLTGLENRRAIMRWLSAALKATRDQPDGLSVVFFDIDHFKSVNDRFGHDVGDEVLKRIARAAAKGLRATDLIGRYGGEEFILLLPNTNAATALHIAERVRAAIEASEETGQPKVTVSLGVATLMHDETAGAILKRADLALYAAKEAGRNQLRFAA